MTTPLQALMNYQQADEDGIMVLASRQAIHETKDIVDEMSSALRGLLDDINCLMDESFGVTGLHLNGEYAPWADLTPGGTFERLTHINDAYDALAKAERGK